MKYIVLVLLLWSMAGNLSAQILTGIVLDTDNREPVIGAHVYLEGSSLFDVTNVDGRFEIAVNTIVNIPLVIRHITYQPVIIPNPFTSLPDTIFVKEQKYSLNEIVVQASKYTRREMLSVFRKIFLGTSSTALSCIIENDDKIELWYNNLTHTLSAECDVPIRIHNRYLGYRLYVTLTDFEAEFTIRGLKATEPVIKYQCSIIFEDLAPDNKRIAGRRMNTFIGSSSHFLRALANNTLEQSGYDLIERDEKKSYLLTDCFTLTKAEDFTKAVINIKPNLQSQTLYFGYPAIGRFYAARNKGSETTEIVFFTTTLSINAWGQLSQPNDLLFIGHMGSLRFGDRLPVNYGIE
jgi:hypothetical protein